MRHQGLRNHGTTPRQEEVAGRLCLYCGGVKEILGNRRWTDSTFICGGIDSAKDVAADPAGEARAESF